jgi:hypothetical protein
MFKENFPGFPTNRKRNEQNIVNIGKHTNQYLLICNISESRKIAKTNH